MEWESNLVPRLSLLPTTREAQKGEPGNEVGKFEQDGCLEWNGDFSYATSKI